MKKPGGWYIRPWKHHKRVIGFWVGYYIPFWPWPIKTIKGRTMRVSSSKWMFETKKDAMRAVWDQYGDVPVYEPPDVMMIYE